MKKAAKTILILAIIILAAMFFFNPTEEMHKKTISEHYAQETKKDNAVAVIAGVANALAGALGDQEYKNNYIFSTVTSKLKKETVSIGVMGIVFVTHDFKK